MSSGANGSNPIVSTTKESPCHFPTEYPSQLGCGSFGCFLPSVKIWRKTVSDSKSIRVNLDVCTILNGAGKESTNGTGGGAQRAGGGVTRATAARFSYSALSSGRSGDSSGL